MDHYRYRVSRPDGISGLRAESNKPQELFDPPASRSAGRVEIHELLQYTCSASFQLLSPLILFGYAFALLSYRYISTTQVGFEASLS